MVIVLAGDCGNCDMAELSWGFIFSAGVVCAECFNVGEERVSSRRK